MKGKALDYDFIESESLKVKNIRVTGPHTGNFVQSIQITESTVEWAVMVESDSDGVQSGRSFS